MENKRKRFKIPHIYVLLVSMVIICAVLTWILPAGEFDRAVNTQGYNVVVPGTYHEVESTPVGVMDTIGALYNGMVNAGSIVFFVFIVSAGIGLVIQTGAMSGFVAALLKLLRGKTRGLLIPVFLIVIGIGSSVVGIYSEMVPFIPIFVGVCIAIGYDAIVGMAVVALACSIGYAGAVINPFTVGVAWSIAELPQMSGMGYRIVCHVIMIAIASIYTIRYALKIQRNPTSSLVYEDDFSSMEMRPEDLENQHFGLREKLVLLTLAAGIALIVWGTIRYGWYYTELSSVFLVIGIISGLIMGWNVNTIAEKVAGCFSDIAMAAIMIGIARSILLVLQQGQIIDTITYYLATPMSYLPRWIGAIGMLLLQTILNFLIPSGSGQAATSLPIMIPLADLLGISRQTAVLAFQFGDGLSNMLWPTAMAPIMCSIAGVKMEKWWKWLIPLFALLIVSQAIMLVVSMLIWS